MTRFFFSRKNDNMTEKYPEVVAAVKRSAIGEARESCAIDTEIVAVQGKGAEEGLLAFQTLSTRKRKDVTEGNAVVSVKVFAFDLLVVGARSLLREPLRERRRLLYESFQPEEGVFGFATCIDIPALVSTDEEPTGADGAEEKEAGCAPDVRLMEFLGQAVEGGCEGLMCKSFSSLYEAGTKRQEGWVKLKKDYLDGMGDTMDLVPIGGWNGMGRKNEWVSPWLMACYDPETGSYQSVCRVMSGFDDAFYKENTALFRDDEEVRLGEKEDNFETGERAPFWFEPREVWEIRGADITISPVHCAGMGMVHPTRGMSMRFPRFIRKRPDKRPDQATTPQQIADMFARQAQRQKGGGGGGGAAAEGAGSGCASD